MQKIVVFLKKINNIFVVISIVALMVMMIIGVYNITGRALFEKPLVAAIEITELSSIVFVAFGMAYTQITRSNVIVPVFIDRLAPRTRAIFDCIALILSLVAVGILLWGGASFARETITTSERTNILHITTSPFRILWVASCLFLIIVLIGHLIESLKKAIKK